VEEEGSSELGSSGNVSLLEKVALVLPAVEAGAVKEGSGFLKRVKGSRSCYHSVCHQGVFRHHIYHQHGVIEVNSGSCCQDGCGF
jgi:hypothetical protein